MPAATLALANALGAQEQLVARRSAGAGATMDVISFTGDGVAQYAFAGLDSVRLRDARQVTLPVAFATPLTDRWRLDVTALYASGSVGFEDAAGGARGRVSLSGMSDVRVRATGRFFTDALTLTFGANVPTGRTGLGASEFGALRVLAAPALAMGSTPVGTGPSAIGGLVMSRAARGWVLALGASYEHRGTYQPIAALVAGAPSSDFRPGGVVRTSMAAERSVGSHRLNLGVAADLFAKDQLRGTSGAAGGQPLATVQLGPVVTTDAQLQLSTSRWREATFYGAFLWRSSYARDGITVSGSDGQYLEGGFRGALPVRNRIDLVVGSSARWHSGLSTDQGLATIGVRGVDATLGVRARAGWAAVQPFVRSQVGSLQSRNDAGGPRGRFVGLTSGLVIQRRF